MSREQQHETLFKLHRALTACVAEAPYAASEKELYQAVCNLLVRSGLFQVAWFGYAAASSGGIGVPVAQAGDDYGFLEDLTLALGQDDYEDPASLCLRAGDVCWIKDLAVHPGLAAIRPSLARCGCTSVLSAPVVSKGVPHGALTLYYNDPEAFGQDAAAVLKDKLVHLQATFAGRAATPRPHSEGLETELRGLIDVLPVTLGLSSAEGMLLHLNRRMVETTGYTLEDHVFRGAMRKYVHPDDVANVYLIAAEGVAGGSPFEFEVRHLRKDGRYHWLLVHNTPIRDEDGRIIRWCSTGTDIQQLKETQEKLRQSEADLLEAQKISHTGSWKHDLASGAVAITPEMARLFGVPDGQDSMNTEFFFSRVHPEDRPGQEAGYQHAQITKADFESDYRIVLAGGGVAHVHSVAHPKLNEAGGLVGFVGTVIDVTAAKQAEEALRARERTFRLIVDSMPGLTCTMTAQGEVELVNKRVLDYTGKTLEEMRNWSPLVHPDDLDFVTARWEHSVETGQPYDIEHRVLRGDGAYRWFHVRGEPLRSSEGQVVRWYILLTDIQERKEAGEKLRRNEADLLEAQRLSQTGSWRHRLPSGAMTLSPEAYRILGLQPEDGAPEWKFVQDRLHPDDRESVDEVVAKATLLKADYENDYRIVLPDAGVKHIHNIGHPILNQSGELVEFFGTVMDVTAGKQAEEKIRQSEKEARQLLDLSPLHITELGPDGARLYTNRASLDYYGITLEEWQSAGLRQVLHPQDAEVVTGDLPGKLQNGSPFEYEARLKRKDGHFRWFHYRLSPMSDQQGRITRWYAAGTDIDDRKLAEQRLQEENVVLREEIDKASMFEEIVGTSAPLKSVLSRISKVAPTDSSVLITGETGTGKELVARAIHRRSPRFSHAFVSVNCAVIPRDLIASELFGHEKGAFTGATQRRLGRFELAEKGTIFLDEIGELPEETQVALLRVLQEREFRRIGGTGMIRADVRVIAATNRDLESAIEAGKFRSDLFYRLAVFPVEVPPLRERREDIPLLVTYFLNRYARKAGRHFTAVDKKSLELLASYAWPGNIRELQNVIERSVIVSESETFSVDESWLSQRPSVRDVDVQPGLLNRSPAQEKALIEAALRECGGRVYGPAGAAARLGIARTTLESKIKSLKINKNRFKDPGPSKLAEK